MRKSLILFAIFSPLPALAELRFHLDAGAFSRTQLGLDLAELAGATGFGEGSDATPAALGIRLGFGVQMSDFEVGVDVGLAAGGLDLLAIEERYVGAVDEIGGSSTLTAGLRVMWVPTLDADWQLLLGPQAAWQALGAASGVGDGNLTSLGLGGLAGVRWRTHEITPTLDGSLQLTAEGLAHLPLSVRVGRGTNDVVFESQSPEGLFGSFGLAVSYCFGFR